MKKFIYKTADESIIIEGERLEQESRIVRVVGENSQLIAALRLKTGEYVKEITDIGDGERIKTS